MSLAPKKMMAAKLLKVGVNRVRFNQDSLDRISDAVTREDLRRLIKAGDIWAAQPKGISSGRKKFKKMKKSKRGRGMGSKEGKSTTRQPRKETWIRQVRALRRYLKLLKEKNELNNEQFRRFYRKVKGGEVRTLRRLKEMVEEERRR
ncbi:MAG: 50S ribosomal protein L19e [Conexivisphaerales archaeon]